MQTLLNDHRPHAGEQLQSWDFLAAFTVHTL